MTNGLEFTLGKMQANFEPKLWILKHKLYLRLIRKLLLIIFAETFICMTSLTLSLSDWNVLRLKLLRKYNHLTEEDLAYEPGQEGALVSRLAKRLRRNERYVLFTLKKGLADLDSNRL